MVADLIEFARRQPRVDHNRPGIDLAGGKHQGCQRQAVFADDHHAVARTHTQIPQCRSQVRNNRRQHAVAPGRCLINERGMSGRVRACGRIT
jgi:hypothetical protein